MNAKEASAKIDELVNQAYALVRQAEALADEHMIGFDWSLGYGLGGFYYPHTRTMTRKEALALLEKSDDLSPDMRYACKEAIENTEHEDDTWCPSNGYDSYGWQSSSSSC